MHGSNHEVILEVKPQVASLRATWDEVPIDFYLGEVESVPYVPLIPFNIVGFQQCKELFFERALAVVFFLVRDIFLDGRNLGASDREDAIPTLPGESGNSWL